MRALGLLVALVFVLSAIAVVLSIPAGFGFAVYKAYPRGPLPVQKNPSWLDTVFENTYVIFAARIVLLALALVLLFGGIYVAASTAVRMWRREWLRRLGPFEPDIAARVEREVGTFEDETESVLRDAWEQNEALEGRLEAVLQELERVTVERDRLVAQHGPAKD